MRRPANSGLTDVINGVTLNLASDAAGASAKLSVVADMTNEKNVLNTFIKSFNSTASYLSAKQATVKQADGTYKRGWLAATMSFSTCAWSLSRMVNGSVVNSGSLKNLSEIGITLNDDMQLSISDTRKLESALTNDRQNVTALMDALMTKLDSKLSGFTGTSGYVVMQQKSIDLQITQTNLSITQMNERLTAREAALQQQYAEYQAQLLTMSIPRRQMSAMYGDYSSSI